MTPDWTNERDSLHREIAKLRQELIEKDCKIDYLSELLRGPLVDLGRWKLTVKEEKIVRVLLLGGVKDRSVILELVYDNKEPLDRTLDVFVGKIRHKFLMDGIKIQTRYGQGYQISDEDIAKVKQMCAAPQAQAA